MNDRSIKEFGQHITRLAGPLLILLLLFRLLSPSLNADISFSQAIYDRNGELLRLTLSRDDKYRLWLPLQSIAPVMVKATLLHEDKWFRFHPGVSPVSLARAVWHTYIKKDRKIGGSTITMQLARIKYKINSRTILGKAQQILAAIWLELLYSKNDLLEAYLNVVPYGLNVEGAGAASLIYFHKNADKLTLSNAITLSVIPQSPARRMASRRKVRESTLSDLDQARKVLFAKWVKKNSKYEKHKSIIDIPVVLNRPSDLPFRAPHFVNEVCELNPFDPVLHTTLDLKLQTLIERHVRGYVEANRQKGINNAVVLLVDIRTLEVRSHIGSANFFDVQIDGQVNGVRAKRSPGSALKPFIYGLGLDQGLIHPLTMLKDAPMSFGSYNPENFDNDFMGPIKVRDALVKSRNVPAVEIASKIDSPGLHGFLLKAGITRMRDKSFYGMSLALGSAEVTMEELVKLYAMLANDGTLKPLNFFRGQKDDEGQQLLSKEASFLVLDMLALNPPPNQGYRSNWVRDQFQVSWKTGTSFGFRDAWSVGVVGPYVLAVWIGNFDGDGNPAFIGRSAAAPLFFEIIDSLKSQDANVRDFPGRGLAEMNLAKVEVCSLSGGFPGVDCSQRASTWFIPGRSPIAKCDVHRRIFVNSRTGLRACTDGAQETRSEVYEFWSSDLLAIFRQAGIPRRVPPPYEAGCNREVMSSKGVGPQITSPRDGVIYSLRASSLQEARIPFTAVTEADTHMIYWFMNEQFLGTSSSGQPFFWLPKPGKYAVRAVDDSGRASVREVITQLVD